MSTNGKASRKKSPVRGTSASPPTVALPSELAVDNVIEAARKAETALPRMVQAMIDLIEDPGTPAKAKVSAFTALQKACVSTDRLKEKLGIRQQKIGTDNRIQIAIGDVRSLKAMDQKDRAAYFLKDVLGGPGLEEESA